MILAEEGSSFNVRAEQKIYVPSKLIATNVRTPELVFTLLRGQWTHTKTKLDYMQQAKLDEACLRLMQAATYKFDDKKLHFPEKKRRYIKRLETPEKITRFVVYIVSERLRSSESSTWKNLRTCSTYSNVPAARPAGTPGPALSRRVEFHWQFKDEDPILLLVLTDSHYKLVTVDSGRLEWTPSDYTGRPFASLANERSNEIPLDTSGT